MSRMPEVRFGLIADCTNISSQERLFLEWLAVEARGGRKLEKLFNMVPGGCDMSLSIVLTHPSPVLPSNDLTTALAGIAVVEKQALYRPTTNQHSVGFIVRSCFPPGSGVPSVPGLATSSTAAIHLVKGTAELITALRSHAGKSVTILSLNPSKAALETASVPVSDLEDMLGGHRPGHLPVSGAHTAFFLDKAVLVGCPVIWSEGGEEASTLHEEERAAVTVAVILSLVFSEHHNAR